MRFSETIMRFEECPAVVPRRENFVSLLLERHFQITSRKWLWNLRDTPCERRFTKGRFFDCQLQAIGAKRVTDANVM
jgi:hypothetical protein